MNLAATVLAGVDRAVVPLDRMRRATYRAAVPWLGAWIRDRDVRIGLHGVSVVLLAWLGAVLAPLVLLALGPLLLGVPHLLADLRYLVVRPGLHRRRLAVPAGILLGLCTALGDLRWGLGALVVAALAARGRTVTRLMVLGPVLGLLLATWVVPYASHVVLGHVHNLVALALWIVLGVALHGPGTASTWSRLVPTGAFLLGGGALLGGAADGWIGPAVGPSLGYHAATLAPGLDPVVATRWVVLFAFAQAVHYGIWLRVMPEVGRDRPAPRSWGASVAALRRDLGEPVLAGFVLLTLAIAVWGLVDLVHARAGYLRLALFHGPLELAVLVVCAIEGPTALRGGAA